MGVKYCGNPSWGYNGSMNDKPWIAVTKRLAPEGVLVETKIDDAQGVRCVQHLSRSGRLWFAGNMYVYYEPTHWREIDHAQEWWQA